MKSKALSITLSAILTVALAVLIITVSIGLPIYFRPFYYLQIEPLGLPEITGFTYEQIKDSFDQLMDFLVFPGGEFTAGVFKYSEEGKSHFVDCKALFTLNSVCLILSLFVSVILLALRRLGIIKLYSPKGIHPIGWAGGGTLALFALLGGLIALDFERAFTVFHSVFFPGKDNWMFNPRYDQIILALPETFFMRCAVLIISSVILLSMVSVVCALINRKRTQGKYAQ